MLVATAAPRQFGETAWQSFKTLDYSRIVTVLVQPVPENADGFLRKVASSSSTHFGRLWLAWIEERPVPAGEPLGFNRSASTVRHGVRLSNSVG